MALSVASVVLLPGYLGLSFWWKHFPFLFTLNHKQNFSPTLLQEIFLLHMPTKWPQMNMDFDLSFTTF